MLAGASERALGGASELYIGASERFAGASERHGGASERPPASRGRDAERAAQCPPRLPTRRQAEID